MSFPKKKRSEKAAHASRRHGSASESASGRTRNPDTPHRESSRHETRPLRFVPKAGGEGDGDPAGQCSSLFGPVSEDAQHILANLPALLDDVMPQSAAHRRALPDAVRELSATLTSERSGLAHPYWSAPRLISAYLRYFLPWNLVRLTRFLPGLPLPAPEQDALIVDFGSGPLTFPIALWLAFPEWRAVPVNILAVDASSQAMDYGRALFERIAPDSSWRVRTLRAPLHRAIREVRGKPSLISFGNVLNELAERKGEGRSEGSTLAERMQAMAAGVGDLLDARGTMLCVEPGTRLGGTVLEHMRAGGINVGMRPLSPCTHGEACPLLTGGPRAGWCHAVMDTAHAPQWLRTLAGAAGLGKVSLSLSHLVMTKDENALPPSTGMARVLSDAFAVPGLGLARYVCSAHGLGIIPNTSSTPQGAVVAVTPVQPPRIDAKSGAKVMQVQGGKKAP